MNRKILLYVFALFFILSTAELLKAQPSPNALADQIIQMNESRLSGINNVEIVTTSDMPIMTDEVVNVYVKQVVDGRAVLRHESQDDSEHELVGGMFDGSFEEIIRGADSVTNDTYNGKRVYKVEISDKDLLNEHMEQDFDVEDDIVIEHATLWLDRNDLVPHKMEYKSNPSMGITFRILAEDYRNHSGLPIAHLVKIEIDGMEDMFSDEEIAEAREMMKEIEEQLAAMPESQRRMIERQMSGQMEQFQAMLNSETLGGFSIMVKSVTVN